MVTTLAIYEKDGSLDSSQGLFNARRLVRLDPKVIYDDASVVLRPLRRLLRAGTDPAQLLTAISTTSDPNDPWDLFHRIRQRLPRLPWDRSD
jgi:hypothetical protein